jgi:hypothetical protein
MAYLNAHNFLPCASWTRFTASGFFVMAKNAESGR